MNDEESINNERADYYNKLIKKLIIGITVATILVSCIPFFF